MDRRAVNATVELLDELYLPTHDMAESSDQSDYPQAYEQLHRLVATASGPRTAVVA